MINMNTKSVYQSIADKIFSDEFYRNDNRAAACYFFNALISVEMWGGISYEQSNFFIIKETDNMDRITKLATLLPTKLTLTNTCRFITQIDHGVVYDDELKRWIDRETYAFLPSGNFLNWLQGTLPLLNAGIVSYFPNSVDFLLYPDGSEKKDTSFTVELDNTCAYYGQVKNKDYKLSKIAELRIPYIYDISLSDYGKITVENMDALKNFREFFAKNITGIDFQKEREIVDFQYDLSRSVKDIESAYKKEALKLAGSLVLGTLATVGASLFLFYDFDTFYGTILGVAEGGGILEACKNVFSYQIEKITLKNQDCYFLWLLHK